MGTVVAVLKIMPEQDVEFEAMKSKVEETVKNAVKFEEEPIAFGIKALNVTINVEDGDGGTEPIEKALMALAEVGNVEVTALARV